MINIPKTLYAGIFVVLTTGNANILPSASLIPLGDSANEKKRLAKLTKRFSTIKEFDNIPLPGFTLYSHYSSGSSGTVWNVIDPRGFMISITSDNLNQILKVTGITEGLIQQKCVWARNDSASTMILMPISASKYAEVINNTMLIESKVSMKDVQIGDTVLLQNKMVGKYMGVLSLYAELNCYADSSVYRPTSYLRRQTIEVSPGTYYSQTDLKILQVTDKTSTPSTREESVATILPNIINGTAIFNGVIGRYDKKMGYISTYAAPKVTLTIKEITLAEATIIFNTALKTSDIGMLIVEKLSTRQFLINMPWHNHSPVNCNTDNFQVVPLLRSFNDKDTIDSFIVTEKRQHWSSFSPSPRNSTGLKDYTKFYKIVKNIKDSSYI